MKYSKLTYYFLTLLCFMGVSCTNELTEEVNPETNGPVGVQLTLAFPTLTRGEAANESPEDAGSTYERYVKDVRLFAFVNDKLVEESRDVTIDGEDGATTRNIYASLLGKYTEETQLTIVALINAKTRGVTHIFNIGTTKEEFYRQLDFKYGSSVDWSFKTSTTPQYIPMWGEWKIDKIKVGGVNRGTIKLIRAIAKVGIIVNDGKGLDGFVINAVRVFSYNDKGYCVPINGNAAATTPNIPEGTIQSVTTIEFPGLEGPNRFEDMIYIPEQNNRQTNNPIYLQIVAKMRGYDKTYKIEFKKDGAYYDVLRNHSYIFNITEVKLNEPDAEASLSYETIEWGSMQIDVPSFD